MRLLMIGLGVLSLLVGGAPAAAEADDEYTPITRVSDLPEPVRALLDGPMADPGNPFAGSDALLAGEDGPSQRLIWAARLSDGRYVVHAQRGGRAPGYRTVVIAPSGWEGYQRTGRAWPGARFATVKAFLAAEQAFAGVP